MARARGRVAPALLLCLLAAAPASAAPWSQRSYPGADESSPRVAIAADGGGVAAWATLPGALRVATGLAGRFGHPVTIAARARAFAVAAGRGGRALVAWEAKDGLHIAVREGQGRPFARRHLVPTTGSPINGLQAAADPLGGWVLAERRFEVDSLNGALQRGYHVFAMSLLPSGSVRLLQDLGRGAFGIEGRETSALAVAPSGRAVLAFQRPATTGVGETAVVSVRPHDRDFAEPVALATRTVDSRVAVGADGDAVAGTLPAICGDGGFCEGTPAVSLLTPDGQPDAPFGPALAHPNRAFGPSAAMTAAGGGVLVFQLKRRSAAFSRTAAVWAAPFAANGTLGVLQRLTAADAAEPVVLPLAGSRALALWAQARRLGAAIADADGHFRPAAAPTGRAPSTGHTNSTNRDFRSAGRWAIGAWAQGGRVRVAARRF